jgi:acyl-CoA synthetase (AMP-forming)/AMP-acid ligase II
MPLFHIHGLVAAILASLGAGAGVVCTPGFNALKFYSWLEETEPTWYTAVPTMHQTILDRAPRNAAVLKKANLRFVRSSSASLPPTVMKDLENTFSAPVIEAYGMTEAAHQMASNPLPPAIRKPGTVGPAAGPSVAIMDEQGSLQPTGSIGEVVIRGANVASGYLNNPEANASAFHGDWFRTGDQGVLDEDGYLRLTGRLKEIINRGGEKISPREIDEVMLDHPAVAQVVTFAIPHPRLGEDVAVAIVLDGSQSTSEAELRSFARERLAPFKVPRTFVFVDEMPKGATGKLQRIGLAEKLGVTPAG